MQDLKGLKASLDHMCIGYAHLKEHGIEPFIELAEQDPEAAVKSFPEFLQRTLDSAGGIFRGVGCGGPHEGATAPLLNCLGTMYPKLPKELRTQALHQAMSFLNQQRYDLSQTNVAFIQEPQLIADIAINCPLYWPGLEEEVSRLQGITTTEDFEREFIKEKEGKPYFAIKNPSLLIWALARADQNYNGEAPRRLLSELFPELVDRTQDGIAARMVDIAQRREISKNKPYQEIIAARLQKFAHEWQDKFLQKMTEEKWIFLPARARDLENARECYSNQSTST